MQPGRKLNLGAMSPSSRTDGGQGCGECHTCRAWWMQLEFGEVPCALLAPSGGTNCVVRIHGGKMQEENLW